MIHDFNEKNFLKILIVRNLSIYFQFTTCFFMFLNKKIIITKLPENTNNIQQTLN